MTGFVLIAFSLPLPLLAIVVLAVKLVSALVRRRLLPARPAAAWRQGVWLLLCVAVLCYSAGLWTGHLLDLTAISDQCPAGRLGNPSQLQGLFPLRNACNYADGTSTELVPALINPLVYLCLVAALVCVVMTIVTGRRDTLRTTGRSR